MPLTFIVIGLVLLISAANNQAAQLFALVKGDFTTTSAVTQQQSTSFLPWVFSIFAVGAFGYVPALKTFSRAFLVLIIVVLFLSKNGFFTKLQQAIPGAFGSAAKPAAPAAPALPTG
jgi:hypothetical protein